MELLRWVIIALGVIFAVWYFTGGAQNESAFTGPFLQPPAPLLPIGTGGGGYKPSNNQGGQEQIGAQTPTYIQNVEQALRKKGTSEEAITNATKSSLFGERVSFRNVYSADETDPQKEYIVIMASSRNTEPVTITGWRVKSIFTGKGAQIGLGAYLPQSGQVNTEQSIVLFPGDEAVLLTGRSPKGTSFRLNSCTGYFEQFQNFTPSLPRQCSYPKDDFQYTGTLKDDECLDYLETLNRCKAHITAIPLSLSNNPKCQGFISDYINYTGCVELHKDDADFYKRKWRIYFGRTQELWKERREMLVLYDTEGRIVDSISY